MFLFKCRYVVLGTVTASQVCCQCHCYVVLAVVTVAAMNPSSLFPPLPDLLCVHNFDLKVLKSIVSKQGVE